MSQATFRILLIEDRPEDVIFLRIALERDALVSYQITVAERLGDGLEQIASGAFDAILLDLGLPDNQALEAFERLHRAAGDIPIVVLSGVLDEALALRAMHAGAQDYVVKGPGGWKMVARAIRYAIERAQAQARLRASEKYWHALIDQSSDGIALVDAQGIIRYESPAATRILGYPPEELIGRSGFALLYPDDREGAARSFADILSRPGEPIVTETRLPHKHGGERLIEFTSINWLSDPDLQAIIINFRDVTERKQAEAALKESERRFATAFFTNPIAQSILSQATGLVVEVNEACCSLYGYRRDELIGVDPGQLNLWADLSAQPAILDDLQRSGRVTSTEIPIRRKSGEIRTVLFWAEPIAWKGTPCLITSSVDITDRKVAEDKVHQSEAQSRLLFETMVQGVVYHAADGQITRANPAASRILGLSLDQLKGRTSMDPRWRTIHEDGSDFPGETHPAMVALRTGKPITNAVMGVYIPDKATYHWININAIPQFRPGESAPYEVYATFEDITERKQAEAALAESQQRLRGVIDSAMDAIISADEELRVVMFNGAAEKLFGISSAEALGQPLSRFIPERFQGAHRHHLANLDQSDTAALNHVISIVGRRSDGEEFPAESSISVVNTGAGMLFTAILRDVTERKRTEEALRRRMEDLALINRLNDAVNHGASLVAITELLAEEARTIFGSQSASLYLMDRPKKRLVLQHFTMPPATVRRLERLLGRNLPLIEIPIGGDDHFNRILDTDDGAIYTGFAAVCAWLSDFANTSHIPDLLRPLIRKIVPPAARLLKIRSVLSMPLKAGKEVLGLVELTSEGVFDQTVLERFQNVRRQLTEVLIHRQAEVSLRESEEKYRGLAEASDALIIVLDMEGRIHYLNERAAAMKGIPLHEALGKTLHELIDPAIADLYLTRLHHVITRGQRLVIESPVGDTSYRTSIQPLHDEQGQVTLAILSAIDITELKQAQHSLMELNRSLEERVTQRTAEVQDLYDNAPTGYHSLNAEGQVIMINRTALNWLCYQRDEIIGRPITDLLTPDSQLIFRRIFPAFKQRGYARDIELEFIRKDRSTFPALINATAVYDADGNYIQSRSTVFDITDRKRAERALRESEEQNRLLFESAPDAVVLFNASGEIVRMNHSFEVLSGLPIEAGIGNTLDALDLLPADQVGRLADAVMRTLRHVDEYAAVEFKLRRPDGELRDIGARVYGISLHGSQHFLTSMRDITAEKEAAETLRYANAELERALRMKDEFLANMSHELRTPLHGILAMSESLLEHIHGPLNERQQRSIRLIEDSGRHLLALINDLLDISKIEAGKLELHIDAVLVDEICHASLQFVHEMALKKKIQVEYTHALPGAQFAADAKRLKQMLVNLLSNAVKFTPEGGQVSLSVTIDRGARKIHFAVQDTGPGIAPASQARLFQPFTQLDSQLSRQHEGTGLGLALVKRLAEHHGGTIRLDSTGVPGEGCCFTLTLPYASPDHEQAPARPAATAGPALVAPNGQTGPLVLLVEDNAVNIQVVREFLAHAGYRLAVARTGIEGLELAIAQAPDLILMDIQIPLLDGFEVIRRLRAQPRFAETPIIAITASAMPGDHERCMAAGATDYMSKPLRLKELLDKVRALTGPHPR